MADDKPIDTGKKTVTGRTIWRDPETGEDYSERSTTFEIDGVYYTMPTVAEDGLQYTDDQIRDYVKKYGASDYLTGEELPEFKSQEDAIEYAISRSATRKQKEEPMLQEQMQQFNEGGLRDEGGMVDEESGNEVPIGSTRKEVRDDIPAQVSEGEFVFPADVVRYLGLEKLMEMRQSAKMGLKQMEAMGQMGNSDEATVPDDMPFGMADLVVIGGPDKDDEPEKKAEGGLFLQSGGSIRMPDFDSSNQDIRIYVKEGSPDRRIPFFDGEPVIPIEGLLAQGYVLKGSAPVKTETEEAIPTGGGSDDDPVVPQKTPFQEAGGWDMEFGDPPDAAKVDLWIKEAEKTTGNAPMIATGVAAALGGPLAAFVHLGNKMNAKGRDASFEKALAAAKKTATAGQVAKLNAIDKAIKEGADKNIFTKIVDGISNTLGFGEKEKDTITKVAGKASSSIKQQGKIRPKARPTELTEEGEEFNKIIGGAGQGLSDGALEDADVRQMQYDDAVRDPFRFSPSSQFSKGMAEDAAASVATGQTDLELEIVATNRELGISNDVITNALNSTTTPYEASYSGPDERSLYDTRPFSFPVKKTVGIDAPVGSGIIPEMKSDVTTFENDRQNEYDKLVNANLGFKDAYNDFINQNRFAAQSAQGMKGKTVLRNAVQEQAKTIVDKIVGLVSTKPEQDEKIRDDGSTDPLTPVVTKPDPVKPDPVKPDSVTSSSRRDRDPSTSVAEQMQQNRAFNKQQTKGSGNRDIVFKRAVKQQIDAGNTSIEDMQEKAKQTIKGQEKGKGYVGGSGFKKGGLASRRK